MLAANEALGEQVTCPDCNWAFVARPERSNQQPKDLSLRIQRIRRMSAFFSGLSIFILCLALVPLFKALSSFEQAESDPGDWQACGSLLLLSLFPFVIAQIIHIRANTEK